ncbi:MAG: nucleotidyltransferase domain-containing protein [Desulfamplus sp.]|nr:nucleotidyltransferase domain-containing protein [Desulfamplus sp.]
MDQTEVIANLTKYKSLVMQHMPFDKMFLFGSYAKGEQHQDSDVDVAIVVDEVKGDYLLTRALLWKIRREIDDRIEPVVIETNHDESGFLDEVMKSGILI